MTRTSIYDGTLYRAHLVYEQPGVLARTDLSYRGHPVTFVRRLTREECAGGPTKAMIRDQDGYLWEPATWDIKVAGQCPCGCGN
jgi:hypothetical protein